ncbi:GNAT family N-acetyltransferase [Brachybacterium sacelli]|uniref:GNAT superfamily N-acetyltransferase n=1 Tax=Brachybacterium sacelli TaxID=173364 RepID=A0ABS4WXN9_9MICO|nr:GNAT family N-acetyltransferase [Brachybacterium sacelli]MBP2380738.1 GNAT superfamily N-acetyltransferase [Brachybacterium sacelli]
MSTVRITDVDPTRGDELLAWNSLLGEGFNAGREAAWWASDETTSARYGDPKPDRTSVLLLATREGLPVGAAGADMDPGEAAEVEISVLPAHRRQGVGTALAEAVRDRLRGAAEIMQAETYSEAGVAFATTLGLRAGHREHRLLLDVPVDLEALRAQHARPAGAPSAPKIQVRSWTGACPEGVIEEWARLTTQMEEDVPLGDLTRPAARSDVAGVRRSEQRMADQGWILVRSLARLDGAAVGYTEMFVNRHDPEIITQDDTLVDPGHRGHGVGRALKLANLENLRGVDEAREARWVQTYTAPDNTAMLTLNRAFGFRDADQLTILEGTVG